MSMTPLLRALALGVGPLVVAAGMGILSSTPKSVQQILPRPSLVGTSCTNPPRFKPGYQGGSNYVIPQGDGFKFLSESWLEADVCSAGTLEITADGQLGGSEEPELTIALDTKIIAQHRFFLKETVKIKIPSEGRVFLAYLNDLYEADVRVAVLRDITFNSAECSGFINVDIPIDSGGKWYPINHAASIIRDPPMVLLPCSSGKLTMRVQGIRGNGEFPIVDFRQNGKVIKSLQSNEGWQKVSLATLAAPIKISVSNPYNKTLVNRDLTIRRIRFVPK